MRSWRRRRNRAGKYSKEACIETRDFEKKGDEHKKSGAGR